MILENSNYVYALKDPHDNPAKIFYIGKGTGSRSNDHLIQIDHTSKGMFIKEIINEGFDVIVTVLSDNLTEIQALKLEAEMISAFGTERNGGVLKNSVSPSGSAKRKYTQLNVPYGV